jgi:hypothetical protein
MQVYFTELGDRQRQDRDPLFEKPCSIEPSRFVTRFHGGRNPELHHLGARNWCFSWRVLSCGIWRRVVCWVSTDVSEKHIAYIFRVEEIGSANQRATRWQCLRHIPEDDTLHNHRCENLKSYNSSTVACLSVTAETLLPSRCLATIREFFTDPLPTNNRSYTDTHTHIQQRDLISLLNFFKIRKMG